MRLLLFALLIAPLWVAVPGTADAASGATVLTGKVVTTVTRAEPIPFNAVIDEVLVRPGMRVGKDAPLLRYHLQDEAERVLQREVTTGAATETMRGQILDLERQLAQTQAQRNKTSRLVSSGLGSSQALGRLEADVASLQKRIALLNVQVKKAEESFQARLRELERSFGVPLHEGDVLPETLVLRSPIDGFVLSVNGILSAGTILPAGAAPIQVGQLDPVIIQVPVYEAEVRDIKEGDKAEVEIPSLGDKKFSAAVSEIAWVSNDMNVGNPSYYTVKLSVPNADLELKPGFKAVVRFKSR